MESEEEKLLGKLPMDITPKPGPEGEMVPCNKEMEWRLIDPKEGKLCCFDGQKMAASAPAWLRFPVPIDMIFESVRSRLLLLALVFQVRVLGACARARAWAVALVCPKG